MERYNAPQRLIDIAKGERNMIQQHQLKELENDKVQPNLVDMSVLEGKWIKELDTFLYLKQQVWSKSLSRALNLGK